jgi:hypothetical protein
VRPAGVLALVTAGLLLWGTSLLHAGTLTSEVDGWS